MVLCPADLLLISRFGWLMGALIAAALIGDIFMTPALLAGMLGRIIQNGLHKRVAAAAKPISAEPAHDLLSSPHVLSHNANGMLRRVDHPGGQGNAVI
jgi:hypothetical protein